MAERPYEFEYNNYLRAWKVAHPDDPKGYLSYNEWIKSGRVSPEIDPKIEVLDTPVVDPTIKVLDIPVVDPTTPAIASKPTTPTTTEHVAPDFTPTVPHFTDPDAKILKDDEATTPTTPGHVAPDFTPTVPHITAPNTPTVPNVPYDPRDLATYGSDGFGNVGRTPVSTLSPVSTHVAPDFTPSYTSDSLSGISGTHKADGLISDFKDTHSDFNNIGATGKSVLQPISFNPTVENSATVSGSDSSKVDSAGSEVKTVPDAKEKTKTATKTGLKSARKKKKK